MDAFISSEVARTEPKMIDLINVDEAQVMISPHGSRLWVCTKDGTVLRIKMASGCALTVDDQRISGD